MSNRSMESSALITNKPLSEINRIIDEGQIKKTFVVHGKG